MPMPHRTQMQVIKRRLVGKEGSERARELEMSQRIASAWLRSVRTSTGTW